MVISNHAWEEETRRTLTLIQSELHEAEQEYEDAQEKVNRLTREADAMELALQIHLQRTGKSVSVEKNFRNLLADQRNHGERIKRIAERNNGLLKVAAAADILFNYGLLKSKARINAYRIVYGLLINMAETGIFQKTAPGEFKLADFLPRLELR